MANQQVIDFIKTALAQNQTLDQIKHNLAQSGWQESDVKEALNMISPIMITIPAKKFILLYILTVICLGFLAVIGGHVGLGMILFGIINASIWNYKIFKKINIRYGIGVIIVNIIFSLIIFIFSAFLMLVLSSMISGSYPAIPT